MLDLIIVGGGPAGLTAAAYAIQKRLEVLLISPDLGGKATYRMSLKDMEGHEHITGWEVVSKFKSQLEYLEFARSLDKVVQVTSVEGGGTGVRSGFVVKTEAGKKHEARALIIATGATPRLMGVADEKHLFLSGVSYSAVSHASLFLDKEVAVIGGNDLALRAAAELSFGARKVYLIAPTAVADSPLAQQVRASDRVTVLEGYHPQKILGEQYVEGIAVQDGDGEAQDLRVEGIFVELGLIANSEIVADLVARDQEGRILVDARNRTSRPGIFAAGDVTAIFAEQVLIAVGEGAKAALSAYDYLLSRQATS